AGCPHEGARKSSSGDGVSVGDGVRGADAGPASAAHLRAVVTPRTGSPGVRDVPIVLVRRGERTDGHARACCGGGTEDGPEGRVAPIFARCNAENPGAGQTLRRRSDVV